MTTPVMVRASSQGRLARLGADLGVVAGSALGEQWGSRPTGPQLPVVPALQPLLPHGLRRGSTVSVEGSLSLLLAVLSAASADGAWCVLVDLPPISAEAARDHGIDLARLPLIPTTGSNWTAVVGALLDAFDIVAARPPGRLTDSELRRLAARTRQRGTVLMPVLTEVSLGRVGDHSARWPLADLRLAVQPGPWSGIGDGYGRLKARRVTVTATGRGGAHRPRTAQLWLPNASGGIEPYPSGGLAPVVEMSRARSGAAAGG
jgi:hypothetical protein